MMIRQKKREGKSLEKQLMQAKKEQKQNKTTHTIKNDIY